MKSECCDRIHDRISCSCSTVTQQPLVDTSFETYKHYNVGLGLHLDIKITNDKSLRQDFYRASSGHVVLSSRVSLCL